MPPETNDERAPDTVEDATDQLRGFREHIDDWKEKGKAAIEEKMQSLGEQARSAHEQIAGTTREQLLAFQNELMLLPDAIQKLPEALRVNVPQAIEDIRAKWAENTVTFAPRGRIESLMQKVNSSLEFLIAKGEKWKEQLEDMGSSALLSISKFFAMIGDTLGIGKLLEGLAGGTRAQLKMIYKTMETIDPNPMDRQILQTLRKSFVAIASIRRPQEAAAKAAGAPMEPYTFESFIESIRDTATSMPRTLAELIPFGEKLLVEEKAQAPLRTETVQRQTTASVLPENVNLLGQSFTLDAMRFGFEPGGVSVEGKLHALQAATIAGNAAVTVTEAMRTGDLLRIKVQANGQQKDISLSKLEAEQMFANLKGGLSYSKAADGFTLTIN